MTDHTHDDPWERQIDAQEARLRLTYDLDAFVAAVEAEPHRAHELLDREALPSRWEEAQATLIAKASSTIRAAHRRPSSIAPRSQPPARTIRRRGRSRSLASSASSGATASP